MISKVKKVLGIVSIFKKLLKLKLLLPLIIVVSIFAIIVGSIGSFFVIIYAKKTVHAASELYNENKDRILEIYETELGSTESNDISDLTIVNTDNDYNDTIDKAKEVEGNSILHQVHNAIVSEVNNSSTPGYNYTYAIGTNFTETGGAGSGWIPWIAAPPQAIQSSGFSLKNWSYSDVMYWKRTTGFQTKSEGKSYIGPFQIFYGDYNSSLGRPESSWGEDGWKRFVDGANPVLDGSGDGKADPFNYLDALKGNSNHAINKYNLYSRELTLNGNDGKEDMETMLLASRYVGIIGRDTSKSHDGSYTYSTYPYVESINPHLQLMRKAYEDYKNKGSFYTRFKIAMESLPNKHAHAVSTKSIIEEFYVSNGWEQVGIGYKKAYPNRGHIIIRGPGSNSDQDVHYPFLVYWAGKVAEDNIKEILK